MKNLLIKRVENNNQKVKAEAAKSKQKEANCKSKTTKAVKVEVLVEKELAPEVKTFMLDVY